MSHIYQSSAVLYGLRIVIQLIELSFYKKALRIISFKPSEPHSSPRLKDILFWNFQIRLISKTPDLSVNQSIIFCLLFLMTGSFLHLTNKMMKLLDIYLLIKSKKFPQMTFSQGIEMNYQPIKILPRYFKLILDDCSNFASSLSVLTFSLCCCYFIICNSLSGLPLIYWTELLLLSIRLIVAWISPY